MNELVTASANTLVGSEDISEVLMQRWLSFIGDKTPKTVQTYTRAIRQFIEWLSEQGITHPVRDDILAYRQHLITDLKPDTREHYSPATIQAYMQTVKLFFRWTAAEGIYNNIADNVKGAKVDDAFTKDYLSIEQANTLLQSIDRSTEIGKRDYAIIKLMLTTGLRVIEIARADKRDYVVSGKKSKLFVQGKGHQQRNDYVKLPEELQSALNEYLSCRGYVDDTEPLFCSTAYLNTGDRLTTRSISKMIKNRLISIGIDRPDVTAHSLRHTAGVTNVMLGGSLLETQVLLRHKNPSTTQRYTHAAEREKNNSEARLAAVFK